ncbi:hypothetical protein ABKV19_026590 [Rosa sericea]
MDIGSTRCCLDKQVLWLSSKNSRKLDWKNIHPPSYTVNTWKLKLGFQRLINSQVFTGEHSLNHVLWRRYSIPSSLEESSSEPAEAYGSNDELKDSGQELLAQPLRSNELHIREDALINFKSELAVMELYSGFGEIGRRKRKICPSSWFKKDEWKIHSISSSFPFRSCT